VAGCDGLCARTVCKEGSDGSTLCGFKAENIARRHFSFDESADDAAQFNITDRL
jgi:hypothetical protein